jgi:twitching motility protein PilT
MQLSMTLVAVLSQQLLVSTDGKSRVIAVETMIANSAIRNLIRENKIHQIASAMQSSGSSGMQLMDNALAQLYRAGKISREVAYIYSMDKNYISTLL